MVLGEMICPFYTQAEVVFGFCDQDSEVFT